MTPQEESMLNDLIGRVEQTQLTEKDPEAEQLLNQRLGRNPNALYILAQTVLVQKYALEQAQAQLDQLRQQHAGAQQPAHTTSFLGSLLGHRDPAPPPPPPPAPPPSRVTGQLALCPALEPASCLRARRRLPRAAAQASCAQPLRRPPASQRGRWPFRGSNRCCTALVAVAGLAGGGFFGGECRPEETVINNYYDDPGSGRSMSASTTAAWAIAATMPRTCSRQATTSGTTDDQDDSSLDDASYDDSSFDDSSNDDLA